MNTLCRALVIVPATMKDFDESRPRLDQATGHETRPAKGMLAICFAEFRRFVVEIKCPRLGGFHEIERALERVVPRAVRGPANVLHQSLFGAQEQIEMLGKVGVPARGEIFQALARVANAAY